MFPQIALWGHSLAAAFFGVLAIWLARMTRTERRHLPMSLACAGTSVWGLTMALLGDRLIYAHLAEALRNIGWLGYMYAIWRGGNRGHRTIPLVALYSVLGAVVLMGVAASLSPLFLEGSPRLLNATFFASAILEMIFAVGALMLVHNLYGAATNDARTVLRLPLVALAIIWAYDLNLFTLSYLSGQALPELLAIRGAAVALTAPVLGLSVAQTGRATIQLSRTATFQSLSLIAIGGYLVVLMIISSVINAVASDYARLAQVVFVFGTSALGLVLLPSPRFRAWFRVKLAKHLFQHRYDYRAEWLRFTDTIGQPGSGTSSLEVRIIQAIADITESQGGFLLVPDESGVLICQAEWNWSGSPVPANAASADAGRHYSATGRIIELDRVRANKNGDHEDSSAVPEWLMQDLSAWVMVPLVHFERLSGIVVLQRALVDRTLDWEDFDLLRVVGRQLASYIAEARGQEALTHVQQFDEFNRRFAFIMHDIKNLVSQLTLVTRNAERHAGNPDFQADMIATLKNSTARMNEMLARLSQHNKVKTSEPEPTELGPVLEQIAAAKRVGHPIVLGGELATFALTDPARLSQALTHLVQNAIDASPPTEPITIMARRVANEAVIEVADKGCGMSGHFIRESLFKPFASTKDGGFGIGAFEARSLIASMGGRLDVTSREREGTAFRIILPLPSETPMLEIDELKAA